MSLWATLKHGENLEAKSLWIAILIVSTFSDGTVCIVVSTIFVIIDGILL